MSKLTVILVYIDQYMALKINELDLLESTRIIPKIIMLSKYKVTKLSIKANVVFISLVFLLGLLAFIKLI